MKERHELKHGSRRRSRSSPAAGLSAVAMLGCSVAATAHHSFAMFDLTHPIEVKGTVQEYRFVNPHSWLILEVKDKKGAPVEFRIETNGAYYLSNKGWNRYSLKPGEQVVARVNPMRDGSPGGDLIKVTLSDGRVFVAREAAAAEPPPAGGK